MISKLKLLTIVLSHNVSGNINNLIKSFNVNIDISKFAINLDDYFLNKLCPIISDLSHAFDILTDLFKTEPQFIIQCIVNNIKTIVSYKPTNLNLANVLRGCSEEIIKMGTIRDMEMGINRIIINNLFGIGELISSILLNIEKDLVKQGSTILLHIGFL